MSLEEALPKALASLLSIFRFHVNIIFPFGNLMSSKASSTLLPPKMWPSGCVPKERLAQGVARGMT